jgi:hypothetical protein
LLLAFRDRFEDGKVTNVGGDKMVETLSYAPTLCARFPVKLFDRQSAELISSSLADHFNLFCQRFYFYAISHLETLVR